MIPLEWMAPLMFAGLIFFMLITSYSVLQKRLEQPSVQDKKDGVKVLKDKDAKEQMLYVTVKMENGQPVIRLEDKVVPVENLEGTFRRAVVGTPKNELLLEFDDDVPHWVIVAVQDAASGARFNRVHFVMPSAAK